MIHKLFGYKSNYNLISWIIIESNQDLIHIHSLLGLTEIDSYMLMILYVY